jgi:hypothetical protein
MLLRRHSRTVKRLLMASCALFVFRSSQAQPDDLAVSVIRLPSLQIAGQPARAHTQGLEIISDKFHVTARRDDVQPRRALLLRTDAGRTDWDIWDITNDHDGLTTLDHPGGIQSDGQHLWIPLGESKRHGRSLIRRFPLARLVPGETLKADFEFAVNDHVGAVAVFAEQKTLLGANWDTEMVYVWDFAGKLQRTLEGPALAAREIGVVSGANGRAGLAVQDWKMVNDRLFASGLFRGGSVASGVPQSCLMSFTNFLRSDFQQISISLPSQTHTELAQEAMAISGGQVHFLPEDLGASNRIFRVSVADLLKRAGLENRSSRIAQ